MWLIITKHQNHDPLARQLLVLLFVVTSALLPILSVKSNQSCYIVCFVLSFCLSKCISFCSRNYWSTPCPPFASPVCSVYFSPCHVQFLITSRRVTSPSPSNQIRQQTSKQLHFATQASLTHVFALSSKHFHPDWVIFAFLSKISNLFPK